MIHIDLLALGVIELPKKIRRVHQGTHQNLRKIQDIAKVIQRGHSADFSLANGDKIGNLLKSEKTDPQGLHQVPDGPGGPGKLIDGPNQKVRVFEIEKQSYIDEDRDDQQEASTGLEALKGPGECQIDDQADPQNRKKRPI